MKKITTSAIVALSFLTLRCGIATSDHEPTDTRTNWLMECETDGQCGTQLTCECGVCTLTCDEASDCSALDSSAACKAPDSCEAKVCVATSLSSGGDPGAGGTSSGGSASSSGGTAPLAGASSGGDPSGGQGGSGPGTGGTGQLPAGPRLGEICYDSDSTAPQIYCAEGYCDPTESCTDREPPHCTRVCACHEQGEVCQQVNAGSVVVNEPCCADQVCMKNGLASSGDTEVYTCEAPGTLACNVDCQVRVSDTACGSDPTWNVVWTCNVGPPEVLTKCQDRGTQIPSWCCPSTVMPECIPM